MAIDSRRKAAPASAASPTRTFMTTGVVACFGVLVVTQLLFLAAVVKTTPFSATHQLPSSAGAAGGDVAPATLQQQRQQPPTGDGPSLRRATDAANGVTIGEPRPGTREPLHQQPSAAEPAAPSPQPSPSAPPPPSPPPAPVRVEDNPFADTGAGENVWGTAPDDAWPPPRPAPGPAPGVAPTSRGPPSMVVPLDPTAPLGAATVNAANPGAPLPPMFSEQERLGVYTHHLNVTVPAAYPTTAYPRLSDPNQGLNRVPPFVLLPKAVKRDAAAAHPDAVAARALWTRPPLDVDLAVVIPSQPRLVKTFPSDKFQGFWEFSGQSAGFDMPASAAPNDVNLAYSQCRDDPQCAGFTSSGVRKHHFDISGVTRGRSNAGSTNRAAGARPATPVGAAPRLYTKLPVRTTTRPYFDAQGNVWVVPQNNYLGRVLRSVARQSLAAMAAACRNTTGCVGFNADGDFMAGPLDLSLFTYEKKVTMYMVEEVPPLDYVVPTVASLVKEWDHCNSNAFGGKYHAFVVDVSKPAGPVHEGFQYLQRRYGDLPCLTFVPMGAAGYVSELDRPPGIQGLPAQLGKKGSKRGQVQQALHFVNTLEFVDRQTVSPKHLLVWEDDCHVCEGVFSTVEGVLAHRPAVEQGMGAKLGALKFGNGGAGVLMDYSLVGSLVDFIITYRGSENVDVQMWRFLRQHDLVEMMSPVTMSAHRGLRSSFRTTSWTSGLWKRVECGNELDFYWGVYSLCHTQEVDVGPDSTRWRCSDWPGVEVQEAEDRRVEEERRLAKLRRAGGAVPATRSPPR